MINDQPSPDSPSQQPPFREGFTVRDEANAIVAYAFRNGPIEDLHAGKYSELLNNKELSRITNDEMKTLMVHACESVERLLLLKQTSPPEYASFIEKYNNSYCRHWDR